ncbi:MAG TPA: lactate racemase domain-containing protein, partial [Thermoguttaceae bacterium]|nr:lactate racemase domain-containing protein [Thermoguttaceae bacterium]
ARVVAAVVRTLVDSGVEADGITVLRTPADVESGADDPCRLIPGPLRKRIKLLTHDPTDRDGLAYLAADERADPILVNRAIHDADLVLPIDCLHDVSTAGYFGLHSSIFPGFSDEKTQRRFRAFGAIDGSDRHKQNLIEEADHDAWLLGVTFSIQLIPAAGDRVLHVLAGEVDAVRRRGRELYRAAWGCPNPLEGDTQQASLVVAAIEGSDSRQTWENFGRALATATELVEDGGAIAVCCDLADAPGPAMQRLAGAHSRDSALRRIGKERPADALPAAQLVRALDRARVYLLSRLDPSVVETLDMIHVAAPDELTRLVRQHQSVALVANASRVVVVRDD